MSDGEEGDTANTAGVNQNTIKFAYTDAVERSFYVDDCLTGELMI